MSALRSNQWQLSASRRFELDAAGWPRDTRHGRLLLPTAKLPIHMLTSSIGTTETAEPWTSSTNVEILTWEFATRELEISTVRGSSGSIAPAVTIAMLPPAQFSCRPSE